MTTSYELSLRLKELGVEQNDGEYYWAKGKLTGAIYCHHKSAENKEYDWEGYEERYTILCRAFTLGELVRGFEGYFSIHINYDGFRAQWCKFDHGATFLNDYINYFSPTSPEEAAGELLAAIKEQEKQKA